MGHERLVLKYFERFNGRMLFALKEFNEEQNQKRHGNMIYGI